MVRVRPHGLAEIMASGERRQVGKGVPNHAPALANFEDCGEGESEAGTPGGTRTHAPGSGGWRSIQLSYGGTTSS